MILSAINNNFDESNLSLIAQETMRLKVNRQLIPIAIQPQDISLQQNCYKRSPGIEVTSLYCLFCSNVKKETPKTNLEKCYLCSVTLKFLWTSKFICLGFFPSNVLKLTI